MSQYNIRGFATLEFRDAETNEILRTVEEENATQMVLDGMMAGAGSSAAYWPHAANFSVTGSNPYFQLGGTSAGNGSGQRVLYSSAKVSSKSYGIFQLPTAAGTVNVGPTTIEQAWTQTAPRTLVTRQRYAQPVADRTVSAIFLAHLDNGGWWVSTWLNLFSQCIHHTTEVLDITYRIEFQPSADDHLPVNGDDINWSQGYDPAHAVSRFMTGYGSVANYDISEGWSLANSFAHWGKMPKKTTLLRNLFMEASTAGWQSAYYTTGLDVMPSGANIKSRYLMTTVTGASSTLAAGSQVGTLLRTGNIVRTSYNLTWSYKVSGQSPWIPSSFQYKPVQPIHNHSQNAPYPFVDVNNLATGSGSLSILPGAWQEENGLLEWWRMDMVNTGQTGTAKYTLSKNVRTSFWGNQYNQGTLDQDGIMVLQCTEGYFDGESLVGLNLTNTDGTVIYGGKSSMINSHYRGNSQNIIEWIDTKTIIAFDNTGVTFADIVSCDYTNFDATTTPALPLSDIRQAVSLTDGTLYIADAVAGLWKIVDPLGTPVISQITGSLTDIDINKCYAITEGYNNSLWAVFEGGLAHSTNGGTSWTTYTVQNGGWTHTTLPAVSVAEAITATSNWSTIKMVRADVEQPTHKLGFIRTSPSVIGMVMWWTPGLNAVDFNIANNSLTIANINQNIFSGNMARTNYFKCSRVGGMWALYNVDVYNYTTRTLVTSASAAPLLNSLTQTITAQDGFVTLMRHMSPTTTVYDNRRGLDAYGLMYGRATPLIGISFLYDRNSKPYFLNYDGASYYSSSGNYTPMGSRLYTDIGEGITATTRLHMHYLSGSNGIYYYQHPNRNCFSFERASINSGYRGPSLTMRAHAGTTGACARFYQIIPSQYWNNWNTFTQDLTQPDYDNWLGRYAPTRDMNWMEYRWNGTTWALNYHAPLADSTANTHDGVRKGFEAESHTFRGRSNVDVSSVLSETFTGGMTLAGTYTAIAPRYLGLAQQHVLWSTDKFYVTRIDSNAAASPGQVGLKYKYDINFPGTTVAADTATRYVTTVTSTANTSFDFKQDISNEENRGIFMRPVNDSFVSRKSVVAATGGAYRTLYSPVYSEIAGGDFAIRFKCNMPTTTGPGRGIRIGVRYGNHAFNPSTDTYFSTTGTTDSYGFRSLSSFTVYLAGGTTAPVFVNNLTTLTPTVVNAMTANDHNLTNRLELRFTISGANLNISLVRIETAGSPSSVTLSTCVVAGAGTTYAGMSGIIGITPEYLTGSLAAQTNYQQLDTFQLYNYTGTVEFGKTAYTSTVNVYSNGSPTPILSYSVGTDVPLHTPSSLVLGFETHSKWRGLYGTVSNPQVWNVVWDAVDLSTDYSSLTASSAINTANAPTAALKAQYLMTQALVESKPTHGTVENSTNAGGMSFQFGNGSSNGSTTFAFTGTDFYSWGMFDGLLKDNAITTSLTQRWITGSQVLPGYTSLSSPATFANATTIPNITASPVTELAVFGNNTVTMYGPGYITASSSLWGGNWQRGIMEQSLPAGTDGWIEVGVNTVQPCFFGLTTELLGTAYPTVSTATTGAFFQLNLDGSFSCRVNGTTLYTSAASSYFLEDKLKIERSDSATTPTFRFYYNGVQVASTTTGVQTAELTGVFAGMLLNPTGFHEVKINYVRDFPCLDAGVYNVSDALASGKYSSRFLKIEESTAMISVSIDSAPAIVSIHTTSLSQLPSAASIPSGTVYLVAKMGILAFSSADIGKSVSLNAAPMLYWK